MGIIWHYMDGALQRILAFYPSTTAGLKFINYYCLIVTSTEVQQDIFSYFQDQDDFNS
ncbi:unnamed protein product, partial [Allacma fusca]